jgi:nucleotide-binding universal stress UspA family protein
MIPKKILFCTDFSENSSNARVYAVDFAAHFSASLQLIHVIKSSQLGYPTIEGEMSVDLKPVLDSIQESVESALELIANECKKRADNVVTTYTFGHPANEIVNYASENSIDLIVTGTHGWTGFKYLMLGSTAENIVRKAHCPVLTVRSAGKERQPLLGR